MSEDDQRYVAPSFHALYTNARGRLTEPLASVRARYELSEDMAQLLVDHAQGVLHDLGITEADVLQRCQAGLLSPGSGFSEVESAWVTRRLAELLGWPWPEA